MMWLEPYNPRELKWTLSDYVDVDDDDDVIMIDFAGISQVYHRSCERNISDSLATSHLEVK